MNNYSQRLYVIDEDKYRRMKSLQPLPTSDADSKAFATNFLQNRTENVVDEDNAWARMGARVQPILDASLSKAATASSTPPPGSSKPTSASTVTAPKNALESQIKSSLGAQIGNKSIRLLRYLQNLPGVSIQGDKFVVGGSPLQPLIPDVLEDMTKKRGSLGVKIDPLLVAIASDSTNVANMISNLEAKKRIKTFREKQNASTGTSVERGESDAPFPSPRKTLAFSSEENPTPPSKKKKTSSVRDQIQSFIEEPPTPHQPVPTPRVIDHRSSPKTAKSPKTPKNADLIKFTTPGKSPKNQPDVTKSTKNSTTKNSKSKSPQKPVPLSTIPKKGTKSPKDQNIQDDTKYSPHQIRQNVNPPKRYEEYFFGGPKIARTPPAKRTV